MNDHALWDHLWLHSNIACCENAQELLLDGAIASKNGKIVWLGPTQQLPQTPDKLAKHIVDASGTCITPGLIDCHTHFIYAGNRANEFELRLQGKSYAEITKQGGGIKATVQATRQASEQELFAQSLPRAQALLQSGVTTLEVKSGYGLDLNTEAKMLRVAQQIETMLPLTLKKTFLGAHTIPDNYKNQADKYIDLVCQEMIPYIAEKKLATAVDVFCEHIAFDLTQTEKVFATAKKYNLQIKCHAEQLSASGAAQLAANYGALSVDHLEYLNTAGITAMAAANTVAVLLPGAFYYLKESVQPPIAELRQQYIPIAIASDCNPGTSPILSLPVVMNMACVLFGLTPAEVLQGVTRNAAQALGIEKTHGSLVVGKVADIAIWNVTQPREIMYSLGSQALQCLIKAGSVVLDASPST